MQQQKASIDMEDTLINELDTIEIEEICRKLCKSDKGGLRQNDWDIIIDQSDANLPAKRLSFKLNARLAQLPNSLEYLMNKSGHISPKVITDEIMAVYASVIARNLNVAEKQDEKRQLETIIGLISCCNNDVEQQIIANGFQMPTENSFVDMTLLKKKGWRLGNYVRMLEEVCCSIALCRTSQLFDPSLVFESLDPLELKLSTILFEVLIEPIRDPAILATVLDSDTYNFDNNVLATKVFKHVLGKAQNQ